MNRGEYRGSRDWRTLPASAPPLSPTKDEGFGPGRNTSLEMSGDSDHSVTNEFRGTFPQIHISRLFLVETIRARQALPYVAANTASTLGPNPPRFSPWNESGLSCI